MVHSHEQVVAYTAGLIDGEGTITISRNRGRSAKGNTTWALWVKVTMTHEETVRWLCERWGGSVRYERHVLHPSTDAFRRGAWTWVCSSKSAELLIHCVESLLITKRAQAHLALEWIKTVKYPGCRLSDVEKMAKDFIVDEIREVNLRGQAAAQRDKKSEEPITKKG